VTETGPIPSINVTEILERLVTDVSKRTLHFENATVIIRTYTVWTPPKAEPALLL
jgi:hypothetical protein